MLRGMTDTTQFSGTLAGSRKHRRPAIALPPPQLLGGPVFIHDCVTPAGGETLLSLILKKLAQDRDAPSDAADQAARSGAVGRVKFPRR